MNIKQTESLKEIHVELFAGCGGASVGFSNSMEASGRHIDISVNHDESAIVLHQANHPKSKHYLQSVFDVEPMKLIQNEQGEITARLGSVWASPDCTHFSVASGKSIGRSTEIRTLAWSILKYAMLPEQLRARVIFIENVPEFKGWGPLDENGSPIKEKAGDTFHSFIKALKALNYEVEYRNLAGMDFGATTTRNRFFLIARCDGQPIVWPESSHAPADSEAVQQGLKQPYKQSGDILDWETPMKPVHARTKPLSTNTLNRIKNGAKKFIVNSEQVYFVPDSNRQKVAFGITYFTETRENEVRGYSMYAPLSTITAKGNRFASITMDLVEIDESEHVLSCIKAIQVEHTDPTSQEDSYGTIRLDCYGNRVKDDAPLDQLKQSKLYKLINPQHRMLTPRELFNAQGFPKDFIIDGRMKLKDLASRGISERKLVKERIEQIKINKRLNNAKEDAHENEQLLQLDLFDVGTQLYDDESTGFENSNVKVFHSYSIKEQIMRVGNSVVPQIVEALVRANLPEYCAPRTNEMSVA